MTANIDNFALQDLRPGTLDARPRSQHSALSEKKVAEEFASLLLMEMLKAMRATLSDEGFDGQPSPGRSLYTSLADVEVTRSLATRAAKSNDDALECGGAPAPSRRGRVL
jgi:Rod binding domain-containing protein